MYDFDSPLSLSKPSTSAIIKRDLWLDVEILLAYKQAIKSKGFDSCGTSYGWADF